MLYEVLIPSNDPNGYDETITVDAGNWMSALKSGLARTGEPDADIRGVMCDIKDDNSIHVTDALTRRVFILREVDPEVDEEAERLREEAAAAAEREAQEAREREAREAKERAEAEAEAAAAAEAKAAAAAAADEESSPPDAATVKLDAISGEAPQAQTPPVVAATSTPAEPEQPSVVVELDNSQIKEEPPVDPTPAVVAAATSGASATSDAPPKADMVQTKSGSWVSPDGRMRVGSATHDSLQDDTGEARVISQTRSRTSERPAIEIKRPEASVTENILEDIFLEIQVIHEKDMAMEDAVNFIIDMAMEKVPAESGAILFADVNGRELYFATARGPKANEIMEFRVPMGIGISGFCAKEGVSLAISDAQNDPRFYKEISDALGYTTHSVSCAPIQHEGRVYGCIELMNRTGGSTFSSNEVNALTYIGKQFAEYINRLIMAREKL